MSLPSTTPATATFAACHAGQAARAELDAANARERATLERGCRVLLTKTAADLAEMLDDIHAAVLTAQHLGFDGAEKVDTDALEDAAGILRNVGRG